MVRGRSAQGRPTGPRGRGVPKVGTGRPSDRTGWWGGGAMGRIIRDRIVRQLDAAEGYLMLGLPDRALEILQGRPDWATMQFEASFLNGEALRVLGRYREALKPLEVAAALRPGDLGVAFALGWCYKR